MGELLKSWGIVTIAMGVAYVAANKIDDYVDSKGDIEYSKELSNGLKITAAQAIGIIAFAIDQHI
jgi:hypothetical protein|nr:MAG TPA: hypothetical protein [Caudoviricetes sp.]